MGSELETRIRNVTAVLGPTNTGKTHLAIERMLAHESGMIGLPLRLLAREVYDKICARVGAEKCALITGEEKIKPERARYWVCTVEAMPREIDVEFLAIDEIQLAADPERGHVFTDRLLHARGRSETLMLGAQTMREAISDLIPGANFISRPRLSKLTYAGEKKITRLPTRSAVVTFSANDVYAIAELIRRQRGGAAVVLGALSPRTRNAQVALYQSGDVDFLVATDAIGMGLNLDVDHVAFAAVRKFDGQNHRALTPGELGQIAGRAGRHMNDGTFGVTASVDPLDPDLVERLETHNFDAMKVLQWRNRKLDFGSIDRLRDSLREMPREQRLTRARMADDVLALETVCNDREILDMAAAPAAVAKLWDVCQVPDYRKISSQNHAELVSTLYKYLLGPEERIPEDWFAKQVALSDRTDGDIDTLSNRLAHIRTWTFVSNRPDWLKDPEHWQGRARAIEDALSDALHECLTQRFVDRRTSALMKGMRDKEELNAEIGDDGTVKVESHVIGRLQGFRFSPDAQAEGIHGKAQRNAAAQVLAKELGMRARRVAAAKPEAFKLTRSGMVLWREEEVGKLEAGEHILKPTVTLLIDEHMSGPDKEKVQARLDTWIKELIGERLKPLAEIADAQDIAGLARGIAFRLSENLGVLKRETVASEVKSLDQEARAQLRKYGVRFGAFNIYFPPLLKPAPAELAATLWQLKQAPALGVDAAALPPSPRPGLTSLATDPKVPEPFYRAYGFHVCGPRAVRIDILERLADLIRPLLAWRAPQDNPSAPPPKGSTGDGGFLVTPEMMSILGCSTDELANVLKALGFRLDRRPKRKPLAPAATAPATVTTETPADADLEAAVSEAPSVSDAQSSTEAVQAASAAASTEPVIEIVEAVETARAPVEGDASVTNTAEAEVEPATALAEIEPTLPTTVAGPVGDSVGGAAAGPAGASAAAEAEVEMEDVWRPRRHGRPEERGPRRDRGRNRERERGRQDRPRHADRSRGDQAPGQPAVEGAADVGGAPGQPAERQQHGDRRDRDRRDQGHRGGERDRDRNRNREGGDRARFSHPGGQHRGSGAGGAPGGHGGGRGRDDRRRQDDRGAGKVHTAAPPRKGGADPDSPFAKLSALKAALEKSQNPKS
jgi:ATP-dependent RNA helicase SUPV3L1/SUV3